MRGVRQGQARGCEGVFRRWCQDCDWIVRIGSKILGTRREAPDGCIVDEAVQPDFGVYETLQLGDGVEVCRGVGEERHVRCPDLEPDRLSVYFIIIYGCEDAAHGDKMMELLVVVKLRGADFLWRRHGAVAGSHDVIGIKAQCVLMTLSAAPGCPDEVASGWKGLWICLVSYADASGSVLDYETLRIHFDDLSGKGESLRGVKRLPGKINGGTNGFRGRGCESR